MGYFIEQNDVSHLDFQQVNFSEEFLVHCQEEGFDSLWEFIQDLNQSYYQPRVQILFRSLGIENFIMGSTTLKFIPTREDLQLFLQAFIDNVTTRDSNSWGRVRFLLGARLDEEVNLDRFFAMPLIVSVLLQEGGCNPSDEGTRNIIVNTALKLCVKRLKSQKNNCAFQSLKYFGVSINSAETRKKYGLTLGSMVPVETLQEIIKFLNEDIKVVTFKDKLLSYYDGTPVDVKKAKESLILFHRNHYAPVVDILLAEAKCKSCLSWYFGDHKCQESKVKYARWSTLRKDRTDMFIDLETRNDLDNYTLVKGIKHYPQIAILCCAYTRWDQEKLVFEGVDCIAQFLDWLDSRTGKYNIRAHNGGAFDFYFVLSEILKRKPSHTDFPFNSVMLRGSKILSFEYKEHKFYDTFNHLASSLEKLCDAFKVTNKKITEFNVNGTIMSSKDIMLFENDTLKPKDYLGRLEQLGLKSLYIEYCMMDCIALCEVWTSYCDATLALYSKAVPHKGVKNMEIEFRNSLTIPALAKQGWLWKMTEMGQKIWYPVKDTTAYKLCYNAVIGGISHVQLFGHFTERVCCLDVVSLYVWSMTKNLFPIGEPVDTLVFKEDKLGVYYCSVVKCNVFDPIKDIPVNEDFRLDWTKAESTDRYLSSIDIQRIRSRGGYVEVDSGIYWEESGDLFSDFLNTFTNDKMYQDTLGDNKNHAMRNVDKLTGNSLYGKMLERSKKMELNIVDHPNELFGMGLDWNKSFVFRSNGKYMIKTPGTKVNKSPFHIGVFVLAYARNHMMNLFDAVGRENVIATETDSIYIKHSHLDKLLPFVGTNIGDLDIELDNITESFFLGKKAYALRYIEKGIEKTKYRLKGVQHSSLKWSKYVEWYEKGEVTFNDIQVFTRHLFGKTTHISIGTTQKRIKTNVAAV